MAWRIFLSRIVQIRIGNYSEGFLDNMTKVIFFAVFKNRNLYYSILKIAFIEQIKEHFKNLYRFSKGNKYSCIFSKKE